MRQFFSRICLSVVGSCCCIPLQLRSIWIQEQGFRVSFHGALQLNDYSRVSWWLGHNRCKSHNTTLIKHRHIGDSHLMRSRSLRQVQAIEFSQKPGQELDHKSHLSFSRCNEQGAVRNCSWWPYRSNNRLNLCPLDLYTAYFFLDECQEFVKFNPVNRDILEKEFIEKLRMFSDQPIISGYRITVMSGNPFNTSYWCSLHVMLTD